MQIELLKGRGEYDVEFKLIEDGYLFARVPSIQGCLTQAKSRKDLEGNIRDALGLFVDDADKAKLRFTLNPELV